MVKGGLAPAEVGNLLIDGVEGVFGALNDYIYKHVDAGHTDIGPISQTKALRRSNRARNTVAARNDDDYEEEREDVREVSVRGGAAPTRRSVASSRGEEDEARDEVPEHKRHRSHSPKISTSKSQTSRFPSVQELRQKARNHSPPPSRNIKALSKKLDENSEKQHSKQTQDSLKVEEERTVGQKPKQVRKQAVTTTRGRSREVQTRSKSSGPVKKKNLAPAKSSRSKGIFSWKKKPPKPAAMVAKQQSRGRSKTRESLAPALDDEPRSSSNNRSSKSRSRSKSQKRSESKSRSKSRNNRDGARKIGKEPPKKEPPVKTIVVDKKVGKLDISETPEGKAKEDRATSSQRQDSNSPKHAGRKSSTSRKSSAATTKPDASESKRNSSVKSSSQDNSSETRSRARSHSASSCRQRSNEPEVSTQEVKRMRSSSVKSSSQHQKDDVPESRPRARSNSASRRQEDVKVFDSEPTLVKSKYSEQVSREKEPEASIPNPHNGKEESCDSIGSAKQRFLAARSKFADSKVQQKPTKAAAAEIPKKQPAAPRKALLEDFGMNLPKKTKKYAAPKKAETVKKTGRLSPFGTAGKKGADKPKKPDRSPDAKPSTTVHNIVNRMRKQLKPSPEVKSKSPPSREDPTSNFPRKEDPKSEVVGRPIKPEKEDRVAQKTPLRKTQESSEKIESDEALKVKNSQKDTKSHQEDPTENASVFQRLIRRKSSAAQQTAAKAQSSPTPPQEKEKSNDDSSFGESSILDTSNEGSGNAFESMRQTPPAPTKSPSWPVSTSSLRRLGEMKGSLIATKKPTSSPQDKDKTAVSDAAAQVVAQISFDGSSVQILAPSDHGQEVSVADPELLLHTNDSTSMLTFSMSECEDNGNRDTAPVSSRGNYPPDTTSTYTSFRSVFSSRGGSRRSKNKMRLVPHQESWMENLEEAESYDGSSCSSGGHNDKYS